jgi:hypothetical protein
VRRPGAALLLAALLSGCWTEDGVPLDDGFGSCTEMGCDDRLEVEIRRADGDAFVPGAYDFEVRTSGGGEHLLSCVLEAGGLGDCEGDVGIVSPALLSSFHAFTLEMLAAPTTLTVRVELEGEPLGEEQLTPDYTMVTPNGPDCDPICFQASVSIEVGAP